MKHLKICLLSLGAMLLIASAPVSASAAGRTACDLADVLRCGANVTCAVNPTFDTIFEKWCQGNETCKWIFNLKSEWCTKPDTSVKPEDPEKPDIPETPVIPEEPEEPETPVIPEKPDVPVTPEKPVIPVDPDQDNNQNVTDNVLGDYENQVVALVNKERAAAGLSALSVNKKLSQVAETKAMDLRDKNYFSHTSPTYGSPFDMMKQFGITYKAAGENIAKGQKTPESVMNGWMNSEGHRANILNSKYTEIGVGYVTDSRGNTYWVQMFIRP